MLPASAVAAAALVVAVLPHPNSRDLSALWGGDEVDGSLSPQAVPVITADAMGPRIVAADRAGQSVWSTSMASTMPTPNSVVSGREGIFSDPLLVPTLSGATSAERSGMNRPGLGVLTPPPSSVALERWVAGGMVSGLTGARVVSQSLAPRTVGRTSSGGEDPRDVWLARGLDRPVEFAGFSGTRRWRSRSSGSAGWLNGQMRGGCSTNSC